MQHRDHRHTNINLVLIQPNLDSPVLRQAFSSRRTWWGLAFAATSGAAFEAVGALRGPLLNDRGIPRDTEGFFLAIPVVAAMAFGAIIGGILGGFKGALAGVLIGGGGTIAATEGKEVELPQGSILRLRLDSPLQIEQQSRR